MKIDYNKYYEDVEISPPLREEGTSYKKARREFLFGMLNPEWDILDVGCGLGFDAKFLALKGFHVSGCDVSGKAIEFAESKNEGLKYFLHNFEEATLGKKFDCIYAFGVIEHVVDYDIFLKNIFASIKPGGILVMSMPNVLSMRNRVKTFFGIDDWYVDKYHLHFFSKRIISLSLKNNGFKIKKIKTFRKEIFVAAEIAKQTESKEKASVEK